MPENKKKPGEAYEPSRKSKGGPYKTNVNVGNPFQFKAKAKTKATQKTKVARKPTKKRRA